MLYLIHGDQVEASRSKLIELKHLAKDQEVRELAGKRLELTALTQALESSSLFSAQGGPASGGGGDVMVVIEGFLTHAKKREKAFGSVLAQLLAAGRDRDIVLYEEKEIDKTTVTKLGSAAKAFLFKTPAIIFQFLDNLRPGNAAPSLTTFGQVVQNEPSEIVFSMLVRRVRQLIQLADGITPEGMQGWQAGRLTNQARHFTMEQLVAMHEQLLMIDIAVKTGSSPFTLRQLLEQFIITL